MNEQRRLGNWIMVPIDTDSKQNQFKPKPNFPRLIST